MRLALIDPEEGLGEPRLGLAYLAAYVRKYSKFENKFLILNPRMNIIPELKKFKPDIIGISATSHDYYKVNEFAKKLKKFNVPLIIGGVHISTLPSDFKESEFDIAVIGEGEDTLLEICELLNKKRFSKNELKKVSGIIFRDKKGIKLTKPRGLIKDIDKIPFPARDLLNLEKYWLNPSSSGKRSLTVRTSRGCPYNCVFCSAASFWKKCRFNSAEYVAKEISEVYKKYKIKRIVIGDDLFTVNQERIGKIINLLEKERILKYLEFRVEGRANLINEELCKKLKKMNVDAIDFGLESGSERVLRYLKGESVKVKDNYNALDLCKKYGFKVCGFFVIGSPMETEKDLEGTERLLKNPALNEIMVYHLLPYPGTQVWDYALRKNKIKKDLFKKERKFDGFHEDIALTEKISREKLKLWFERLKQIAEKKNYKNVKFGLKEIRIILSRGGLRKIRKYWYKIPGRLFKIIKYKV